MVTPVTSIFNLLLKIVDPRVESQNGAVALDCNWKGVLKLTSEIYLRRLLLVDLDCFSYCLRALSWGQTLPAI